MATLTFDDARVDGLPHFGESVTVAAGENLVANQVVAYVTATGKIEAFESDQSGGREVTYGVLVSAVDASAADTPGSVWTFGTFDQDKLVFTTGDTAASTKILAKQNGLYWVDAIS